MDEIENIEDSSDNLIIVDDNVYFENSIAVNNNGLINNVLGIGQGLAVGVDANLENVNIFGLLAGYGNIYSNGSVYVAKDNDGKYVYLEGDGNITCNNLQMLNKISINKYDTRNFQEDNSIVINASDDNLISPNKGLYITPIRNDSDETENVLFYNKITKEITFSNNNSSSLASRLDRLSWRFLFGVVTIDAEQADVDDEDDNDDSNSYFVEVKSSSFEFFVNFAGENI